jgi:hypothetical protein
MGGAAPLPPRRASRWSREGRQGGKRRDGEGLTRGPHLAARQRDGHEVDGLRWAERKGRPAVGAGRDNVDFNISVKAQAERVISHFPITFILI